MKFLKILAVAVLLVVFAVSSSFIIYTLVKYEENHHQEPNMGLAVICTGPATVSFLMLVSLLKKTKPPDKKKGEL